MERYTWCVMVDDSGNGPGLTLYELGPGTSETEIAMNTETTNGMHSRSHLWLVGIALLWETSWVGIGERELNN